jgi:hypothetical protein
MAPVSETEPAVGGDADGTARRVGYAELCVSHDNRKDELMLLGNGVVPQTAERAWRVLYARLTAAQESSAAPRAVSLHSLFVDE